MTKTLARWESRGGKHHIELLDYGDGYGYAGDSGGMLAAKTELAAIDEIENKLDYLFPDKQKAIIRVK